MTLTFTHAETGNDDHMMEEDTDLTPTVMHDKPFIQEQIDVGTTHPQYTRPGDEVAEPALDTNTTTTMQAGEDQHGPDDRARPGQCKRTEETAIGGETDNSSKEALGTTMLPQNEEKKQDDATLSPKRKKKVSLERSGDQQNERTRIERGGQLSNSGKHNSPQRHASTSQPARNELLSIATLNINGITASTRVGVLAEFIRKHDVDTIFLQEVTSPDVLSFRGYETYLNNGTSIRGTAIVEKCQHQLTNVFTLPTGRAIAATLRGIRMINAYAPSGTARRAEREDFYNVELTQILQDVSTHILPAGDFNCVLHPNDTTGQLSDQ